MTKLVEVARALAIAEGMDPDAIVEPRLLRGEQAGMVFAAQVPEWMNYVAQARAAILAMRDPTPEMCVAGWAHSDVQKGWNAMVDAALTAAVLGIG